jgi:hypothetical protein
MVQNSSHKFLLKILENPEWERFRSDFLDGEVNLWQMEIGKGEPIIIDNKEIPSFQTGIEKE